MRKQLLDDKMAYHPIDINRSLWILRFCSRTTPTIINQGWTWNTPQTQLFFETKSQAERTLRTRAEHSSTGTHTRAGRLSRKNIMTMKADTCSQRVPNKGLAVYRGILELTLLVCMVHMRGIARVYTPANQGVGACALVNWPILFLQSISGFFKRSQDSRNVHRVHFQELLSSDATLCESRWCFNIHWKRIKMGAKMCEISWSLPEVRSYLP